jgi:hypothetical protein
LDVRAGHAALLVAQKDPLAIAPGVRLPPDIQVDVGQEICIGLGEEAGGDVFGYKGDKRSHVV